MATESFSIDTSDMQKCARDLATAGEELRVVSPVALREGAQVAAAAARGLSSWSSRIPGTIMIAAMGDTVLVRAGGAAAPHASVYEHGGNPGTFLHPTYGHAPWVPQQARPFLAPSAIVGAETTERIALRETDRVLNSRNL